MRNGGGLSLKMPSKSRVGSFWTASKYTLWDAGFPCISSCGSTSILGEVFKIKDLGQISKIHSMKVRAGYVLESIDIKGLKDVKAYFQTPDFRWDAQVVPGGDWVSYKKSRPRLIQV